MFMGEYNHTLDTKGRLIIPSKFRETLGEKFVVTKGLDGCLFVYDNAGWTAFEEKLQAMIWEKKKELEKLNQAVDQRKKEYAEYFQRQETLKNQYEEQQVQLEMLQRDQPHLVMNI